MSRRPLDVVVYPLLIGIVVHTNKISQYSDVIVAMSIMTVFLIVAIDAAIISLRSLLTEQRGNSAQKPEVKSIRTGTR